MAKDKNLITVSKKQREELRAVIYRAHKVAHEYVQLPEDDMRRAQICSNSRSAKCNGERAEYSRANKVYCAACYERTNKARMAIVRRADAVLANVISDITEGVITYSDAVARYS